MDELEHAQLDNAARAAAGLFLLAASKARKLAAYEAAPDGAEPPMGTDTCAQLAADAVDAYCDLAAGIGQPSVIADDPAPLDDETAVAGLTPDLLRLYRGLAAIRPPQL